MVSRQHLAKYNFWKASTLVILYALCYIFNAVGGHNRVEMWKQPPQKMTAAVPKLQVNLNLKAPKPTTPSSKHESNVYLDVNTFYRRKNKLRSEKRKEKGKIRDSHRVFCTEKYKKGILSAEGSSRITPVHVESHINRPVKTRVVGKQRCILSLDSRYKSSCCSDFIAASLLCCQP